MHLIQRRVNGFIFRRKGKMTNMRKKIFNRSFVSIILFLIVLFCTAVTEIPGVKAAVDGGTDICLKMQTRDLDINDIPDDGIVNLDITIDNNSKIDGIGFIVKKDSRLEYDGYSILEYINDGISSSSHRPFDDNDVLYNEVFFAKNPYDQNGVFVQLKLKIPDNAKVGDYYSLCFLKSFESVMPRIGILVPEVKLITGEECFAGLEDGGIRITDNTPVELVQNDPEPQHQPDQPSVQPVQEQNNGSSGQTNNNNVVGQPTASITTPGGIVSQTVPSQTSSVTNIKATKTTSVSTSLITEYIDTEVTDIIQTDITDEQTSVSDKSNGKPKIIICVSIAVIILTALIYFLYRYRKKDNT